MNYTQPANDPRIDELVAKMNGVQSQVNRISTPSQPQEASPLTQTPPPSAAPPPEEVVGDDDDDESDDGLGIASVSNYVREDKASLPQHVSREFRAGDKAIQVNWDRNGGLSMQTNGGNVEKGKTWADVVGRLKEHNATEAEIAKLREQYENRKTHTAGRSKGIVVTDDDGNEVVVKSYAGDKITMKRKGDPKSQRQTFTGAFGAQAAMRKMGLKGKYIQETLQNWAQTDEQKKSAQNSINWMNDEQIHRTKFVPKGSNVQAMIDNEYMRVGRLNAASGKWEYKNFEAGYHTKKDLEEWMGKDAGEAWKKWDDIHRKTQRHEAPEASKALGFSWYNRGHSDETMRARRKWLRNRPTELDKNEKAELEQINKRLNPNAWNIKREAELRKLQGTIDFKPGETLKDTINSADGHTWMIGSMGGKVRVDQDPTLWEKVKNVGSAVGKVALDFAPIPQFARKMGVAAIDALASGDGKLGAIGKLAQTHVEPLLKEGIAEADKEAKLQSEILELKRQQRRLEAKQGVDDILDKKAEKIHQENVNQATNIKATWEAEYKDLMNQYNQNKADISMVTEGLMGWLSQMAAGPEAKALAAVASVANAAAKGAPAAPGEKGGKLDKIERQANSYEAKVGDKKTPGMSEVIAFGLNKWLNKLPEDKRVIYAKQIEPDYQAVKKQVYQEHEEELNPELKTQRLAREAKEAEEQKARDADAAGKAKTKKQREEEKAAETERMLRELEPIVEEIYLRRYRRLHWSTWSRPTRSLEGFRQYLMRENAQRKIESKPPLQLPNFVSALPK
jgi:hypothetical protein